MHIYTRAYIVYISKWGYASNSFKAYFVSQSTDIETLQAKINSVDLYWLR